MRARTLIISSLNMKLQMKETLHQKSLKKSQNSRCLFPDSKDSPSVYYYFSNYFVRKRFILLDTTGSNPVDAPKIFFSGLNSQLQLQLRWSHLHFKS